MTGFVFTESFRGASKNITTKPIPISRIIDRQIRDVSISRTQLKYRIIASDRA